MPDWLPIPFLLAGMIMMAIAGTITGRCMSLKSPQANGSMLMSLKNWLLLTVMLMIDSVIRLISIKIK